LGPHHRLIGFDDVVPICLDELANGRVVALEHGVGGGERHINSSVERFAQSLVLYQQYREGVRAILEDSAQELIARTADRVRAADPSAFIDPNNCGL
jgi:hypothetical protein